MSSFNDKISKVRMLVDGAKTPEEKATAQAALEKLFGSEIFRNEKNKESNPLYTDSLYRTTTDQMKSKYISNGVRMTKKLLPYQIAGAKGMRRLKRCILGDEMGLGKTIQAVASAAQKENQHILIITLNGLQTNWESEIRGLVGEDQDIEVYDYKQVIGEARWVIIHYDAVRMPRNLQVLTARSWDVLIVDEAHKCKSHKARTKNKNLTNFGSVKRLSYRSKQVYLLSGTPMRESPEDVWALLNFIDRGKYSSFYRWAENYIIYEDGFFGRKPVGYKNLNLLSQELSQYMIRRLKSEVIDDLPEKQVITIKCEMKDRQRKIYNQMLTQYVAEIEEGVYVSSPAEVSRIMRLRQIATDATALSGKELKYPIPSGKMQTLRSMAYNICLDMDEKLVVFSNWSRIVNRAADVLKDLGCVVYTGDCSRKEKDYAVEQFQTNPDVKVFIATIGAAGTGLTLTAASKMIFTDRAWVPDDNSQAEDRIYARINDVHGATIYKLVTEDSMDELIEQYVADKKANVDEVIGNIKSAVRATNK